MTEFKSVTEQELKSFVASFPRDLSLDVCGIVEPPQVTYNDFTLGKWPDSVVVRYFTGYMGDQPRDFEIKK